jgi:predicted nucleotidyltransferase
MVASRIDFQINQVVEFCQRWQVNEFSLFGSVLRDDFRPDSDVDVLVSFNPTAPWSLFDLVTMQDELQRIFGRPVDLVEREGLRNPFRKRSILNGREVIYASPGT